MSNTKLKCLSIIVFYHSEDEIEDCLNSFRNQSVDSDLYIHFNSSVASDLMGRIKQYCKYVIPFSKNIGFGTAVNEGFKLGISQCYDYIVLVNPDVHFKTDPLKKGIELCQLNENRCILSPIHLNDANEIDPAFYSYIAPQYHSKPGFPFKTHFVNAAFWIIPMNVVKTVGGFDPLFHVYGEDSNYVLRLKMKGLSILVVPELVIYHTRKSKISNSRYFYLKRKASLYNYWIAFKENTSQVSIIGKLRDDLFSHKMGIKGFMISWLVWTQTIFLVPMLLNRFKKYHEGVFLN